MLLSMSTTTVHVAFLLFSLLAASAFDIQVGILVRLHGLDGQRLGLAREQQAAAALMAVNHIRDRNPVLVPQVARLLHPDLNFTVQLADTFSTPSTAMAEVLKWTHSGDNSEAAVSLIVGASRSAVSGPVSLLASIPQVTYPHFSRVIPADTVLTRAVVHICEEFAWTQMAIIAMDDSYGRRFAQALASYSTQVGLSVVVYEQYQLGSEAEIQAAVRKVKEAGVRIIVCLAFANDIETVAVAANQEGIGGRGYVWITSDAVQDIGSVVASSSEASLASYLTGWMSISTAAFPEGRAQQFTSALAAEPLSGLSNDLFDVSAAHTAGCSDVCGYMYDAVFGAAAALSESWDSTRNRVDLSRLNTQIRALDFQGATGRVQLDPTTGDRLADAQRTLIRNWQPDGAGSLREVAVWEWEEQAGLSTLAGGAEPVWPGGIQTWTAPLDGTTCGVGTVLNPETLVCELCPAGTAQVGTACAACETGKVAPVAGLTQCVPCSSGYADREGMAECVQCGLHAVMAPGSLGKSAADCVCEQRFWLKDGQCVACPAGAHCEGGTKLPHPQHGFWGERECTEFGFGNVTCANPMKFFQCNPDFACENAEEFTCREGHTGRMCLEAEEGWFIVGNIRWYECGAHGKAISVIAIVAVILVWFGINKIASGHYDAMDIALLFVQVTGMISTYGMKWHENLWLLNFILGVANFDVDFVQPNCIWPWWDYVASFFLQLALPFAFGIIYFLYYTLTSVVELLLGRRDEHISFSELASNLIKNIMSFAIVVYHTLSTRCFQALKCADFPDGKSYLAFHPSIECWTGVHWYMAAAAGIYIPVVIIGIPVIMFIVVYRMRKKGTLNQPRNLKTWGFLHARYEHPWKMWEVMLLLRRLLIALVLVSVEVSMLQAAVTMVILVALLALHVYTKPYINPYIDILDFCSICGSMAYLLAGMLMYPSITTAAQGLVCSDETLSDDLAAACQQDRDIKFVVSVLTIAITLLTVAVSFAISFAQIREVNKSKSASKLLEQQLWAERPHAIDDLVDPSATKNKVSLDQILAGDCVLRWAEWLRNHRDTSRLLGGANAYLAVDVGVRALQTDVSQNSSSFEAAVLRHLTKGMPGLIDWLALADNRSRKDLYSIVEKLAQFKSMVHDMGSMMAISGLIREEHQPVAALFLMRCSHVERTAFLKVVDGMLLTSGGQEARDKWHQVTSTSAQHHMGIVSLGRRASEELDAADSDSDDDTAPQQRQIAKFSARANTKANARGGAGAVESNTESAGSGGSAGGAKAMAIERGRSGPVGINVKGGQRDSLSSPHPFANGMEPPTRVKAGASTVIADVGYLTDSGSSKHQSPLVQSLALPEPGLSAIEPKPRDQSGTMSGPRVPRRKQGEARHSARGSKEEASEAPSGGVRADEVAVDVPVVVARQHRDRPNAGPAGRARVSTSGEAAQAWKQSGAFLPIDVGQVWDC